MTAKIEEAKYLFTEFSGVENFTILELPQSGSARRNFVVTAGEKYIVTHNEDTRENAAFLYFSEIFEVLQLNTPKIFHISADKKWYIQEFLGENTLSQIIEKEGLSQRVQSLIKEVLQKLFELQTKTKNKVDYSRTFEYEAYNHLPILHDLNYFKFLFVDILGVSYQKSALLKEFNKIAEILQDIPYKVLMIRDFQSRNIIVNERNEVGFIDYQSAMLGPAMYDVISLLYQAKANFPEDFREEMLNFYINLFDDNETKLQLKKSVKPIRLIRNLQVLGAYGLRGLVERKEHFLKSIPQGIKNLTETTNSWEEIRDFPELKSLIEKINTEEILTKINNIIN
ncbi:MAG: phosphotransferase [Bergeyella zoohelcum]|nr:phosphotransferase [Bergeyella zoohelcum]